MLPIHKVISYQRSMPGGSTKPWLVLAEKNRIPAPFVIKLYKSDYVEQYFSIAKEVYCSALAQQFGIRTPYFSFFTLSKEFKNSLDEEQNSFLIGKQSSITFGTELIQGAYPFQEELHRDFFWKFDIETIYAFDNLIKNSDRKLGKPNLLIKNKDLLVIDHEQTFTVNKKTLEHFENGTWIYWKENHIFYRFLKERGVEAKRTFFLHFLEKLKTINFDLLDPYYEQLSDLGLDNEENFNQIKNYLWYIKKNASKFVKLLIGELG